PVVTVSDAGVQRERAFYSPYGRVFGMPAGDLNFDGEFTSAEATTISGWSAAYRAYADINLDGVIDGDDATANSPGTLGWDALSRDGSTIGYAGYVQDSSIPTLSHVRHRVYKSDLGRWVQRDPAGYVDGANLYEYARSSPVVGKDAQGLKYQLATHVLHSGLAGDSRYYWYSDCIQDAGIENCWVYALRQRGSSRSPRGLTRRDQLTDCKDLVDGIMREPGVAPTVGPASAQCGSIPAGCQPGCWLIAAFIDPRLGNGIEPDYHFLRQESDCTWSHKPGSGGPILDVDGSGKIIFDPTDADLRNPNPNRDRNYSSFCGYFCVCTVN
ncbi:MAG: hypothetical protein KIT54_11525, partial [Phycisphaeraceae bacterium]|nr:hypothetical protein [Phycisphaeraceae bacterium]